MSTKEPKGMERSAKRSKVDRSLPSDDLQNPDAVSPSNANNPAADTSVMGSCSSGSGDVTQSLLALKKQFGKDVKASFRSMNENLRSIFKAQQKSRQELHSIHCRMFESLYQKWLSDAEREMEQEENLKLIIQQQMKILQQAVEDHETKIGHAKDLCDSFMKMAKNLSKHRATFIGGEESQVKKELTKAQDRVLMETQEQDVSVVETYLQSLVLDRSEEAI